MIKSNILCFSVHTIHTKTSQKSYCISTNKQQNVRNKVGLTSIINSDRHRWVGRGARVTGGTAGCFRPHRSATGALKSPANQVRRVTSKNAKEKKSEGAACARLAHLFAGQQEPRSANGKS